LQPSTEVSLSKFAEKQLKRIPKHIAEAFYYWVETVKLIGILEVRKFPGYHDEPLKGKRSGYRSIRLNRAYRAIYVETKEGLEIQVIEVNKHEY
jgi:proteic killer suppression protein